MSDTAFAAIAEFGQSRLNANFEYMGELETPVMEHFFKKKKMKINQQGYKNAFVTSLPGGMTNPGVDNTSVRNAIPFETAAMRVYPTQFEMPIEIDGYTYRGLKRGDNDAAVTFESYLDLISQTAFKTIEYYLLGDGTGTLAVSTTALGSTGSGQTINGNTLASAGLNQAADTKGMVRLEKNHIYAAINVTTGAVRGIFTVETPGFTSCVVNLTSGTISANDPIVHLGNSNTTSSYKRVMQGLRSLVGNSNRVMQNINTADHRFLNSPYVNAADGALTALMLDSAKVKVNIGSNDQNMKYSGRLIIMPYGQDAVLRNTGYTYRRYTGAESTSRGIDKKYIDQDGDVTIMSADADDDRVYILNDDNFKIAEERPFGLWDEDSLTLRQKPGLNGVGSDSLYGMYMWNGNFLKDIGKKSKPRSDAYISRISQTNVTQQTNVYA